MPPIETIAAVLVVIAVLIVISAGVAVIFAPRKISDDVMLRDAPHIEREQ
jgi:hypothetical protein